jgi:hypothetical protein
MENEIWKDIEGYEDLYQVSNIGRVRSLDRIITYLNRWGFLSERRIKGVIMSPGVDTKGYEFVTLSSGKHSLVRVHRLVAHAFVSGYFEGAVVNHKDENRRNNRADNLEWVTFAENLNYGTARQRSTEGHGNSRPVEQIDENGKVSNTYPSIEECARQTGKSPRSINRACNRYPRHITKEGYKYRFKE